MLKEAYITKQFYSEAPFPEGPYSLSMFISDHSFIYAISSSDSKSVFELCHVQLTNSTFTSDQRIEQFSFLIQNYFLAQKKFEKVNIAFLNHDFNLVPEAFAPENSLKPMLNFTTGISPTKGSSAHQIKGVKFSYAVDIDLLNYFEKTFVNATTRHAGAVGLSLLFSQHSLVGANVFINIHDNHLELAIKENDGLQFYNVFNYTSNEDILYYLLFTMEQFGLNPLQLKLSVAGQLPVSDDLIKSLKKYIKHVSFCVHDPSVKLSGELLQMPQHYYFTLLNQHICEL